MNAKILRLCLTLSLAVLPTWAADKANGMRQIAKQEDRFLPGIDALSATDQAKLRAARDKALQTPQVQAALVDRNDTAKDFANVQQTALLTADPKISPVLEKVKKSGRNLQQIAAAAAGRNGGRAQPLLSDLSDAERQQLLAAFMDIRQRPEVRGARERMLTASQTVNQALRAAIVKSDPSTAPLMAKLPESPRPRRFQ